MLQLREPIKAKKSERYLAILVDADGVQHYWLPSGEYDGYCRPGKENPAEPPCVCRCDDEPLGKCGTCAEWEMPHCRKCCHHQDKWKADGPDTE